LEGVDYMNNVDKFFKNGSLTINVEYKPLINSTIICIKNGLWYKFNIDGIELLDDNTYNITTTTLLSVDGRRIR
jgi:hypothetical protein